MQSWRDRTTAFLPRLLVATHDLFMVWLCWQLLHFVRYAMLPQSPGYPLWSNEIAIVVAGQGLVFWWMGLYRGLWRFASLPDLWNIVKASGLGFLAIVVGLFFYNRFGSLPRAVLAFYPFALVAFLGLPRLLYRAWKDLQTSRLHENASRVLVLGAGRAGEALVRELRRTGVYQPIGFLDDAVKLHGSKLLGVPVLGSLDQAASVARESAARMLVIAMPSLDAPSMQRVVAICESTGLPFRMVPRLINVLEGHAMPGDLKEVAIEDLLGRKSVTPDWKLIRGWLGGRTVLVTGAGGSIGSELCRQCARHGAQRIALLEIDELALITIQADLRRAFPDLEVLPVLGNCGDPAVVEHALALAEPDAVFHAAAYKQVPLLEQHLREAVGNNVLATDMVAKACRRSGVGTFVLISTDKAVDPVNVLGATKRLAEMVCQATDDGHAGGTRFVTVRFGNVLDSAGSVVPLFREQIRKGGPVTVTDPEVTRYFMTIPEASQLILQAAAGAAHAAIYTLDMGEAVPIRLLAEQMIRLAGKQPGRDIAIVYTGLRPGEKLHENLFHADEAYRPTSHSKIMQAEARTVSADFIELALQRLRAAYGRYDVDEMQEILRIAVPEFSPLEQSLEPASATIVTFPAREARRTR
ncbi:MULTISPECIES: nucleoside-diphosphate sugar epimerase/dehydratase [unclassified Pseudoxanthomonas]|uniref:nucleoside-diphosphate sugar epimerase/dehydratase n=1 Tax=unclassified Pseudoxanthomonas TaxID=2645906 RepID=UPI001609CB4E|nr:MULTISPECIES: nucleoside-diphosphate sugar epimerase/dehydratase [unclassified Pseudoxanthomonas]MBB3274472.1 FlaA1/EpsC-like NDP-sugar epimerase [Pseudoxanthomonas sp. OG2]MBD9378146.1 polysaccharide biosynthesis protein [Pseudoxanthomonas sp. PXM04]MBV7474978.1 polysaccharide biosynthesis protein [Pseudoxanthomonas sp. PXM05]